jgi:microcystin-dependent protein
MPLKLTNNATSLLAAPIDALVTTITISSGDEGNFPVLGAGDYFPVTVVDTSGNREIMRCSAIAGVTLTVARGQENTAARAFVINSRVEVRLTAGALIEQTSNASALTTGTLADARLPDRLKPLEKQLGVDINGLVETGRYWTASTATNTPLPGVAGWLWADVVTLPPGPTSGVQHQEWQEYGGDRRYRRQMVSGLWQAWEQIFNTKPDAIPIGSILDYGGTTAPTGWVLCYGQQYIISTPGSTYYALYQVLGTRYNNPAPSAGYFRVPDYRGRVGAGFELAGGGATTNRLGAATGGVNGDVLGATGGEGAHVLLDAELSSHSHGASTIVVSKAGAHTHDITLGAGDGGITGVVGTAGIAGSGGGTGHTLGAEYTGESPLTTHDHTLSGSTGLTGSDTAHNIVQPTIIVNKIIKYA